MADNVTDVINRIATWKLKVDGEIDNAVKQVVDVVWEVAVDQTPIDTGFAISNWRVSNILNPAAAGAGVAKKKGDAQGDYRKPEQGGYSPKKPVFVFNATYYIDTLESSDYSASEANPMFSHNATRGQMVFKAVASARNRWGA